MAASSAADPAPALFLLDAGALRGPGAASTLARPWSPPTHYLDTPERLLACYQLIRARRPEARTLVFLEGGGYNRLCLEWQGGACRALEPSGVLCVPFGCRVGDFLLEFARRKAVEGFEVVVVSNVADIVVECRSVGPQVTHLGFMFVEGDILLPGLAVAGPRASEQATAPLSAPLGLADRQDAPSPDAAPARRAARAGPPVQRSIAKAGGSAAAHGRRWQPPGTIAVRALPPAARPRALAAQPRRTGGEDTEEREETLRDSQLDGVALDEDAPDTFVDESDDAFADTVVDLPYREAEPMYDEAFAETLADVAVAASTGAAVAASSAEGGHAGRLEDTEMAAAFQDAQMASAAGLATAVTVAPAGLPPAASQDDLPEAGREPEHQSQLPELEAPSSPDMEVEVDAGLASPQQAFAAQHSQPSALASPCSQTLIRANASGVGCSQTIEIDAADVPPQPPSGGASSVATADAGAGLQRQATVEDFGELEQEEPALPVPEAIVGEVAAVVLPESAEPEEADEPMEPTVLASDATASTGAAAASGVVPAPGSQGVAGSQGQAEMEGAGAPAEAEATVEVVGAVEAMAGGGSQAATVPARSGSLAPLEDRQIPASVLLGRWVRDGGREHAVVWTPGPAGSFLEFRPAEPNKRCLPILSEGGSWVLNGFHLDASRSSAGLLHWANRASGAERSWRRQEVGGGDSGGAGAADAVSALAGSFSGEACC